LRAQWARVLYSGMGDRTDAVWKSPELAAVYLEGVRGAIPLAMEQIDVMLRLIGACGERVERVLDVGCGDGVLAAAVLQRFPGVEAVLADFSAPMLEAARGRLGEYGSAVRFVEADYGLPEWTGLVNEWAPYDAIISGYSIHHQPDERKRAVYGEVLGLLRPGGMFVNVEHVASASPWVGALNDELFVDHLHGHHPGSSREEVARKYYDRPDKAANILAPVERQCEWLTVLGYRDVDCYLKVFELAVFGGRRATRQKGARGA
jgi:tRNA (cmo5U34)-methyltransferase